MRILAVRPELCVACGACEEICALTFFKVPDLVKSAIRVSAPEPAGEACTIEFCDQCGECIAICPTEALFRAKNGLVRIRKKDCVGCLACVGFCPTLVMYVDPDSTVPFKCVACAKCVDECPADALYMIEVEVPALVSELTRSVRFAGEHPHGG
jgi:Fe-S-cluster-containing dehydrogenase component